MQQLHLVGFTADNQGLIFSARKGTKSGGFVLTLDRKTLATVEELVSRREADAESERASSRPISTLSPREMQARLRAGRSLAQVAREAGVEEEWVGRFAAPIRAEQIQVVDRAQALVLEKARLGPSAQPLGEAVRWNMAEKGIVFTDAGWGGSWEAFHLRGSSWIVRFSCLYRRKPLRAEWEADVRDGTIISRNRQGTELGFVANGRRRPRPSGATFQEIDATPAPVAPAVKVRTPAALARTPQARPKKAATKKVATKKAATKKAATKIAPRKISRKASGKNVASGRARAKKPATKKARPAKASAKKPRPRAVRAVSVAIAPRRFESQAPSPAERAAPSRNSTRRKTGSRRPAPVSKNAPARSRQPERISQQGDFEANPAENEPWRVGAREAGSRDTRSRDAESRDAGDRAPIKIDSNSPRRQEAQPIIRADRADQPEPSLGDPNPVSASADHSDDAPGRGRRFRFGRRRS